MENERNADFASRLDDQALLDTPALIDAVLRETGFHDLHLVGHSKGATGVLALLAERPEYNSKVMDFHEYNRKRTTEHSTCSFINNLP